jgi:hypothetical protein
MTRTVLTLTSSPQRMQHLPLVLDALCSQLVPPDAVYLNLPERYRNRDAYILPDWLGDASQVTLLRRADDPGPVMTMFGTRRIRLGHCKPQPKHTQKLLLAAEVLTLRISAGI